MNRSQSYEYIISAREVAWKKNFFMSIIVFVLGIVFLLLFNPICVVIGLILMFGSIVILLQGVIWLIGGGKWDIYVNQKEILWVAPVFSEGSFEYSIGDIDHVRKTVKVKVKRSGEKRIKHKYHLIAKSGKAHKMSNYSGADVDRIVEILMDAGVKVEVETRIKDRGSED